jgi:hypothetical protein
LGVLTAFSMRELSLVLFPYLLVFRGDAGNDPF